MAQKTYAEMSKGYPPSKIVLDAIKFSTSKGRALDLGAGSLRNTPALLDAGFEVDAVDRDPLMQEAAAELGHPKLHTFLTTFLDFEYPVTAYDFILAKNTLPFESPSDFPALWKKILSALAPGGIFCGTFFGPNDTWSNRPHMNFLSRSEVEKYLAPLEKIAFTEIEEDREDIQGNMKHWHVFEAIARKH